jgi:hypothetical protein
MVINATTALTIITHFDYKEEFIKQLNAYSYRIEKRKTTNIGATFRSVTLLILDSEKHNELEDKDRFPPNTIFTEKASVVSMVNSSFLIFSEFLNFPKFNYSLFFIHSFKAWTPYNIQQWELTKKEAVLLLNNPPTNTEASTYTTGCCKQITDKEARIPALKKSIESWTTGKELHAGRLQGDCNSKTLDFPEPLLCILFVLRYAITNRLSLNDLKRLLPTIIFHLFHNMHHKNFMIQHGSGPTLSTILLK